MAPIARLKARGPCDLAIVTGAAELSFLYRIHGDLVGARLHLEWSWVASVTFVPDPMKPVWKDCGRYSSLAAFPFENDVPLDGKGNAKEKTN